MAHSIEIVPGHPTMQRDQPASVRIDVTCDRTTRVRGIYAEFRAAERTEATYTVTTRDSKGNTRTETRTAVEHVAIAEESFTLAGIPQLGFFGRLWDAMLCWVGRGQAQRLEPGQHSFEIQLRIPPDAPASLEGKKCEVFYRLQVRVDRPLAIDWRASRPFEVLPPPVPPEQVQPVHVQFPDAGGRSFWDKVFGQDVTLNLALDRDTLRSGGGALAMLTVEAQEPLKVNQIEIDLVGQESSHAHGHSDSYTHRHSLGDIQTPKVIATQLVHEFQLQVPTLAGPFTQRGRNFEVSWSVEIRLRVPWSKDPIIRVPVTLLQQPGSDERETA